jgi:methionyl-tRNA formyltransferase
MQNLQKNNSTEKFTFGLLSTLGAPLLPLIIESALVNGCDDIVVICDSKSPSEKDKKIWNERTGGKLNKSESGGLELYNFGDVIIPFYFVDSHNSEQAMRLIKSLKIDCLFNAGTPRKISSKIIESVEHGVVNVHPGVLPKYRGCTCVEWAIFNDDKVGNTAHFMSDGYDSGPIIACETYDFSRNSDYQSIRIKVYQDGCLLAGKVLKIIKDRKLRPVDGIKQNSEEGKAWSPIPKEKMDIVIEKLQNSKYRYQINE